MFCERCGKLLKEARCSFCGFVNDGFVRTISKAELMRFQGITIDTSPYRHYQMPKKSIPIFKFLAIGFTFILLLLLALPVAIIALVGSVALWFALRMLR